MWWTKKNKIITEEKFSKLVNECITYVRKHPANMDFEKGTTKYEMNFRNYIDIDGKRECVGFKAYLYNDNSNKSFITPWDHYANKVYIDYSETKALRKLCENIEELKNIEKKNQGLRVLNGLKPDIKEVRSSKIKGLNLEKE